MPPTYSARSGRIAFRALSTSSLIITFTEGQILKSSSDRPALAAPSSSGPRSVWVCSGEKKTGSQPSAISPARATFFGPSTARKIGIWSWTGRIVSLSALPGPSGSGSSSVSPWYSIFWRASAMRTTATYSRVRCSCLANRTP